MASRSLLCVHAHPDDEALFTAGTTLHYSRKGVRTILITCTLGQLGIDGHGLAGAVPGHDALATRVTRAGELQRAGVLVGYDRLISLGHLDSGMSGWATNQDPDAFINADVDATARVVADIIDQEDAAVVVTYDEGGFYGHPDHVMANVITRRAAAMSARAQRLFYPVIPRGVLGTFLARARARGVFLPAWVENAVADIPDDAVDCVMDVARFSALKQEAIATHASQVDNADLVTMEPEMFNLLLGTEYYQVGWQRDGASLACVDDLFGGL